MANSRPRSVTRIIISLLVATSLVLFAIRYFTSTSYDWLTKEPTQDFQSDVKNLVESYHQEVPYLRGIVVITKDGNPIVTESIDRAPSINLHQPYLVGSISKVFTASALQKLALAGKLKLSDRVCVYLTVFCAKPYDEITIEQILSHYSGLKQDTIPYWKRVLRDWISDQQDSLPRNITAFEYFSEQEIGKLESPPGKEMNYSNFGFLVLSAIIEKTSGQPYGESIKQLVLKPAELTETSIINPANPTLPEGTAQGHILEKEKAVPVNPIENVGLFFGAGAIATTAFDLMKWGVFLSQTQNQKENPGWVNGTLPDGSPWIWHNGRTYGYSAQFHRLPKQRISIIVLMNISRTEMSDRIAQSLVRLSGGLSYQVPIRRAVGAVW